MSAKIEECCICHEDIDIQYVEEINNKNGTRHKKVFWSMGHNAEPIQQGRCCTVCNTTVVIPQRILMIQQGQDFREAINDND
jgi:hypothetical protein|tara:strand:+ start:11913 stop:12158 length:246 start_codon:yes stop_codon:yes gene_type:complete